MLNVGALRLALREVEVTLPYTKDSAGRPLTVVLRALDPERALALRKRLPGTYYEAVESQMDREERRLEEEKRRAEQGESDDERKARIEHELTDAELILIGARALIEEGVVGFKDADSGEMVPGRVRFADEDLDEHTMDGRILTAHERTTLSIEIAKLSGEGEVAAAHGRFRIRERRGMQDRTRAVEVHEGNGSAAAPADALPDGRRDGAEVDQSLGS
jgi:hypothetical protein